MEKITLKADKYRAAGYVGNIESIIKYAGKEILADPSEGPLTLPEMLISESRGKVCLFTNHLLKENAGSGMLQEIDADNGFLELTALAIIKELPLPVAKDMALPDENMEKYAGIVADHIAERALSVPEMLPAGDRSSDNTDNSDAAFGTDARNILLRLVHFVYVCLRDRCSGIDSDLKTQKSRTGKALKKLSGPVLKLAACGYEGGYSYPETLALKAAACCLLNFG